MFFYEKLSKKELEMEHKKLLKKYDEIKNLNLKLNMARGKPSKKQLNLSLKMLTNIKAEEFEKTKQNLDPKNYGELSGVLEAKEFFSNILDVPVEMIFVGGNSSLNMMFSYLNMAMQFGVLNNTPWNKLKKVKFLCPCPGYDRHFAICELFNIEMINIKIEENGPDMAKIKELIEKDELIKGIWCVPKYSNPTGTTYNEKTVKEFASLNPKAKDFRIFWDNAYAIHDFPEKKDELLNIFKVCKQEKNKDFIIEFCSTSKITFPSGGISAIAASKKNIENIVKIFSKQIICYNLINQIRHAKFFPTHEKLKNHMKEHAKIIKPKFDVVIKTLEEELKPLNLGNWTNPNGGYFISFNSLNGTAKKIFNLCKNVGLTLTSPGATFPYFKDPQDSNIRIAPTYPELSELKKAIEIFCLCVKIAAIEKIL